MSEQEKVEEAVRKLIQWSGDDVEREGLHETPKRVADAYREFFSGYHQDPKEVLAQSFSEVGGYQDLILLENIPFHSHCEHHMIPFFGRAHIAYIPKHRVVGFSRLIRVLEIFSRRLQIQERLTNQVASLIQDVLQPRGVAVLLSAQHLCMSMRGIRQQDVYVKTHAFTGCLLDPIEQERLFQRLS